MVGMLYRLLAIWLLIAVALSGFYAVTTNADDASKPPQQWQYEESLIVPALIPEDRCVRAVYLDPALKAERGFRIEWWHPPIEDYMARWLDERRRDGRLSLTFCNEESI